MSEELAAGDPRTPRRGLLLGAGAAGLTAVLAGCGTDTADNGGGLDTQAPAGTTPPADPPTGGDSGGDKGGGARLAAVADVPVGGGVILASQGVVVTQPSTGTFKCFSAICTHQGCPVSAVDDGTIVCTCHNSKFSIADGSVKEGPAKKALAEKTVKKDGEHIVLG